MATGKAFGAGAFLLYCTLFLFLFVVDSNRVFFAREGK